MWWTRLNKTSVLCGGRYWHVDLTSTLKGWPIIFIMFIITSMIKWLCLKSWQNTKCLWCLVLCIIHVHVHVYAVCKTQSDFWFSVSHRCACLDMSQASHMASQWTPEMDAALVLHVNSLSRKLAIATALLHPHEIQISEAVLSSEKLNCLQGEW